VREAAVTSNRRARGDQRRRDGGRHRIERGFTVAPVSERTSSAEPENGFRALRSDRAVRNAMSRSLWT
jgi:hypothetical protein